MAQIVDLDGFTLNGTDYNLTDHTARTRIDNLVANNNPTEGNSELIDIRVGHDGTTYTSAGAAVRGNDEKLDDKITELKEDLSEVTEEISDINSNLFVTTIGKNKYNSVEDETGYYTSDGTITGVGGIWNLSGFIPVEESANYVASATYNGARNTISFFFLATFDSEQNFLRLVANIVSSPHAFSDDEKYFRFSYKPALYTNIQVEIGTTATDYEDYTVTKSENYVRKTEISADIDEYFNGIGVNIKPFFGKKWAVFGDSLTEKNIRAKTSYYDYIASELGVEIVNYGKSGTGYMCGGTDASVDNSFHTRMQNIDADAFDVLTIFGSGNDGDDDYPLGTATDTGTTTIGGCINATLDVFYSIAPFKPIGIISPCPWVNSNPDGSGNTSAKMDGYAGLLETICKIRGIPYLDLRHCSGLRPWNSDFRAEYYVEPKTDGSGEWVDSGIHPNSKGHKIYLYPKFREFLKSLMS